VHGRPLDLVANAWWLTVQGGPKNGAVFVRLIMTSNIEQFSKLFRGQNREKICH